MFGKRGQGHHPFPHKGGHKGFEDAVHVEQQRETALFSCIRGRRTSLKDQPAKMERVSEPFVLSRAGYLLKHLVMDRYMRNAVEQ